MPVAALDPGSALARALAADRGRFNARFAAARAAAPGLEPADFAAWLAGTLAPLAEAVAGAAPERLAPAVEELYGLGLDLLARRVLGPESRTPPVGEAWRRLLPALAAHVAADPGGTARAVTNAVHALAATPGARPGAWIARLAELGPRCAGPGQLREAGAVAAWHCGMAHLRDAALAAAARLPADLAAAAIGLAGGGAAAAFEALRRDPWLDPAAPPGGGRRELRVVARAGAFTGFGGQFREPPRVAASGGALYARDREWAWRIHADAFGTVLLRHGPAAVTLPPDGPSAVRVDREGRVAFAGLEASFPELAGATSFAAAGATAAVTIPLSHAVALVAAVPPR